MATTANEAEARWAAALAEAGCPGVVRVGAAADYVPVSARTLARWARLGLLRTSRVAGSVMVTRAELARVLAAGEQAA